MIPTHDEIATWLTERRQPEQWADFLTGLPWDIIKPGVQIAGASKVHPSIALAAAAAHSGDQRIRDTISHHLAQGEQPAPNRAQRRAAARSRRKAR